MSEQQIATFTEERKWDYRGIWLVCRISNTVVNIPQFLVLLQLFWKVFQLLAWFSRFRIVWELLCGHTVGPHHLDSESSHHALVLWTDLEKRQHFIAQERLQGRFSSSKKD